MSSREKPLKITDDNQENKEIRTMENKKAFKKFFFTTRELIFVK